MDKKKKCLIKHIIELGKFFMECDGNVDDREIKFIKDYTDQMIANKEATLEEMKTIEESVRQELTIDYLIDQTKLLLMYATNEEKKSLIDALSSYIQKIIMVDNVLHANEVKYYKEWQNRTKMNKSDFLNLAYKNLLKYLIENELMKMILFQIL